MSRRCQPARERPHLYGRSSLVEKRVVGLSDVQEAHGAVRHRGARSEGRCHKTFPRANYTPALGRLSESFPMERFLGKHAGEELSQARLKLREREFPGDPIASACAHLRGPCRIGKDRFERLG